MPRTAWIKNDDKDTLLVVTAYSSKDSLDTLKSFLNNVEKAVIDEPNKGGNTALYEVAVYGREGGAFEKTELLIQAGAHLAKANGRGITPFYQAVCNGNEEMTELFLQHVGKKCINEKGENGNTPLHAAIWNRSKELVGLLLKNGAKASISEKGEQKMMFLFRAVSSGKIDIVELLLTQGAATSIDITNEDGNTPWHAATYKGEAMVELLLQHCVTKSINNQNNEGNTPLHCEVYKKEEEIAKLLLDHGTKASINAPNKLGATPSSLSTGTMKALLESY